MIQLSLLAVDGSRTFEEELDNLAAAALASCGATHVTEATRVTAARFRSWTGLALSDAQRMRARAYFGAVLRRRIIGGRDAAASSTRRRLVEASIQADLRAAGWDPERAAQEARRITGGRREREAVA